MRVTKRGLFYSLGGAGSTLALLLLMGPTPSGFPSRPLFQAATIGAGTRAGTGDLRLNSGSIGLGAAPAAANATITAESANFNETTDVAFRATRTDISQVMVVTPTSSGALVGTDSAHSLFFQTAGVSRYEINSVGSSIFYSSAFIQNASPVFTLQETDAALDEGLYTMQSQAGVLTWGAQDDSLTPYNPFLTVDRTGADVDSVILGGTNPASVGVVSTTDTYLSTGTGGSITFDRGGTITDAAGVISSSYVGAVTGCTTNPAPSIQYTHVGVSGAGVTTQGIVTVNIPAFTCTSNATTFTITGMPAASRPSTNQGAVVLRVTDNGTAAMNEARMLNTGAIEFLRNGSATGWTNAGTKGLANPVSMSYQLQ